MAVPRTHDGSVGHRSASSTQLVLTVVFAVVVVACLVILGIRYASSDGDSVGARVEQMFSEPQDTEADEATSRNLVLSQANQFVLRVNTYGPGDLDTDSTLTSYGERVGELTTPKFSASFQDEGLPLAQQTVADAGYGRTVEITATGVESIGNDRASVLVAGAFTSSYPSTAPDADEADRVLDDAVPFRWQVRLVRTEGRWLVDDFAPVTGAEAAVSPGDVSPVTEVFAQILQRRSPSLRDAIAAVAICGFPAPATDAGCADDVTALSAAALPLQRALQGATNPDSQVYAGGEPDETLGQLIDGTRDAAAATVEWAGKVSDDCVTTASPACQQARKTLSAATTALTSALDLWEPYL